VEVALQAVNDKQYAVRKTQKQAGTLFRWDSRFLVPNRLFAYRLPPADSNCRDPLAPIYL